jgi:large repetitive protein
VRGFVCPPVSGNYTFWIAGDDNVELYLSTSEDPAKKVRIAYVATYTNYREWNKFSTQKSAAISLVAGNRYYIEALHKEAYYSDHLSVGWQIPDAVNTSEMPIPGNRLLPYSGNTTPAAPTLTADDASNTLAASSSLGTSEIVVSENGAAYTAYAGTINVGNVARAAGYWKFKIKASSGRNESSVVNSPAFTVTTVTGCSGTGSITRDYWSTIYGQAVSDIPLTTTPTSSSTITIFETGQDIGDNYGERMRGYICPPQSGAYTFWISGDDNVELWLSTSSDPAVKVKIAYVNGSTAYRQWDRYTTQKSASINLVAGTRYYIEALHKESLAGDHVSVGWQLPDATYERPIGGNRLIPFSTTSARTADEEIAVAENSEQLNAFPNPFSREVSIAFKTRTATKAKLQLYHLNGTLIGTLFDGKVVAGESQLVRYDARGLLSGMYLIRMSTHEQVITHKVILNKE